MEQQNRVTTSQTAQQYLEELIARALKRCREGDSDGAVQGFFAEASKHPGTRKLDDEFAFAIVAAAARRSITEFEKALRSFAEMVN